MEKEENKDLKEQLQQEEQAGEIKTEQAEKTSAELVKNEEQAENEMQKENEQLDEKSQEEVAKLQEEQAQEITAEQEAETQKIIERQEVQAQENVVTEEKAEIQIETKEEDVKAVIQEESNTATNEESMQEKNSLETSNNHEEKSMPEITKNEGENKPETPKNKEEKPEQTKKEANKKEETEYTVVKNKKGKKKLVVAIIISIIILALLFCSVIFALLNMNNDKLLKGISILGIEVGDLTAEQAKEKLTDAIESRFKDENNTLILKRNEEEISVTANTFNAKFDLDKVIAKAHNIGRDGNIITNNYAIILTNLFKKDLEPELLLDEELIEATITDVNSRMQDKVVENAYHVKGKELKIVRGKAGYVIDNEKLKKEIYAQLRNIHTNYQEIEIPTIHKEPDAIDIEKIHSEIYKEPKDAYVEKKENETTVHVHVDGIDFAISMEEAKKLLQEEKEEYTIPLKITAPKKTIKDLGEEAFPDLISDYTTRYDASATNRATNIELAAKKINGTVIMPGEKFSYNTTVGRATLEAGFKEGTAYVGGKVVPDVGGGICQVSSTLYNTALLANLEITERSNHSFPAGYVAGSRDATVYYGSLDFCFKNTRSYPVKIVASAQNGVCKVSMYGIKEKVEYEVVIQSKITSYINQTVRYVEDPTLEEGKEVVEQTGSNGFRSEGYRILKLNGKVVSQTLLSKDTYSAMEKIIRKGTKKVATPQTPTTPTNPATSNN